jgi:hypothetical protein
VLGGPSGSLSQIALPLMRLDVGFRFRVSGVRCQFLVAGFKSLEV